MSWLFEVSGVGEAAAGLSLRSRWSGWRGCDRGPGRPASGVASAPESVPLAHTDGGIRLRLGRGAAAFSGGLRTAVAGTEPSG